MILLFRFIKYYFSINVFRKGRMFAPIYVSLQSFPVVEKRLEMSATLEKLQTNLIEELATNSINITQSLCDKKIPSRRLYCLRKFNESRHLSYTHSWIPRTVWSRFEELKMDNSSKYARKEQREARDR